MSVGGKDQNSWRLFGQYRRIIPGREWRAQPIELEPIQVAAERTAGCLSLLQDAVATAIMEVKRPYWKGTCGSRERGSCHVVVPASAGVRWPLNKMDLSKIQWETGG